MEKTIPEYDDAAVQLQTETKDPDPIHGPGRWKGKEKATGATETMYYDGTSADDLRGFIAYCETERAYGDDNEKINFATKHLIGTPALAWESYRKERANYDIKWQDFLEVLEGDLLTTKFDKPSTASSYPHESLTSFHNNGVLSTSASAVKVTEPYDLINFLAVAQHWRIDMLPFMWESEGPVGIGGTANVFHGGNVQTSEGLQMSFVFKRVRRVTSARTRQQDYQALLSEVYILGHPAVRHHPNIIALEGFCWETVGAESWPVLVFKRTTYGDLGLFMLSEGRTMGIEERVKLCREIGDAIILMHSCHIVHGDLKPENILIFLDVNGQYSARVADFGYSTLFAEDSDSTEVSLPMSWPWTAPEVEGRHRVTFADAKSADVFSYGLICLWLLSYEIWPYILTESANTDRSCLNSIWEIKRDKDIVKLAHGIVSLAIKEQDDEQNLALMLFFSTSLSTDPNDRRLQISSLGIPFNYPRESLPLTDEYGISASAMTASNFDLVGMFSQFMASGMPVWQTVRESLEKRVEPNSQLDNDSQKLAACQLAFCYEVGFGTDIDKRQSQHWLEQSGRSQEDLNDAIEMIRDDTNPAFKNINCSIDYFDRQKLSEASGENLRSSVSLDTDNEPSRENDMYLGSTAAWFFKSIGIEPGEMRITTKLESETMEEMTERLRQLSKDQFGWKEGEYGTATFKFTPRHDISPKQFPIETFMHSDRSKAGPETSKDEENRLIQSLDRKKKVLGLDHEDTLRSMDALITFYCKHEKWDQAEPLAIHVMSTRREMLGQPHPSTLKSMRQVAGICIILGNSKDGEDLLLKMLDTRKSVLGFKHPDTLVTFNDLEHLLKQYLGDRKSNEAQALVERLLDYLTNAFGNDDDDTLTMMQLLALLLGENDNCQDNYARAENLLTTVIGQRKRLFGKDNRKLVVAMHMLAAIHGMHINEPGVRGKLSALQMDIHNAQARLSVVVPPTISQNIDSGRHGSKEEDGHSKGRRGFYATADSMVQYLDDHLQRNFDRERLDKDIREIEKALETLSDNSPDRSQMVTELIQALAHRFRHLRDVGDLDIALKWEEKALATLPEGDPGRPLRLVELSDLHWLRFETTSSLENLEASLEYGEDSVALLDHDDLARSKSIGNLAIRLKTKYEQVNDIDDLEKAIMWAEQLTLIMTDPTKLPYWFYLLGCWFKNKYEISKNVEDIGGAIEALSKAVDDPVYTSARSELYSKLSELYEERYSVRKDPEDIVKAVQYTEKAVEEVLISDSRSLRGGEASYGPLLGSLASKYLQRSQAFRDIEDLEKAAFNIDLAVQKVPLESRYRQGVTRLHSLIHGTRAILGGTYDMYDDAGQVIQENFTSS